ncbi:MAG: SH3 domain-containing protein [Nitrospinae bacterium]|nr:SH3 domain-containing protein [Nitrospinota bacterium]
MNKRNIQLRITLFTLLIILPFAQSAFGEYVAIVQEKANIRSKPGVSSPLLYTMNHSLNYPLRVLKRSGRWLKVKDYEGDSGWIAKFLTSRINAVIVKKKAHVRNGPGTQFKNLWTAVKGETFRVIEKKGSWLHVIDSVENRGWIYKKLLWGATN